MDDPEFRAYVERFALTLDAMGLQPMAARVLARFVCSDADTLTSGELSDGLAVSPAAVSGAIRILTQGGLVERVPVPGSRRQHFRLAGDTWTGAGAVKQEVFVALEHLAADGMAVVPAGGQAAARLGEMRAFYAFLADEMPALLARWRTQRPPGVSGTRP
jgi:DNA-binding transcriptional ArsR family regulator